MSFQNSYPHAPNDNNLSSNIPSPIDLTDLEEMMADTEKLAYSQNSSENFNTTDGNSSTTNIGKQQQIPRPDNLFASTSSFQDRMEFFLENKIGTDIKFIVGFGSNTLTLHAHKILVAGNSPVFYSMFFSDMECPKEVVVPDCDPKAFKIFLQFLYTGKAPGYSIMKTIISDLLYIARKYLYHTLEVQCILFLRENINSELVFQVMELADIYSLPELTGICWEFIEDNANIVLNTHLESINLDMLCMILRNDNLNIPEIDLFCTVFRWATHRSDQLKQNGENNSSNCALVGENAFKLIRYTTISPRDIADFIVPSKVLSPQQISDIFTYIHGSTQPSASQQSLQPPGRINIEFNTKPRSWLRSLPVNSASSAMSMIVRDSRRQIRSARRRAARQARVEAAVRIVREMDADE